MVPPYPGISQFNFGQPDFGARRRETVSTRASSIPPPNAYPLMSAIEAIGISSIVQTGAGRDGRMPFAPPKCGRKVP